MEKVIGMNEKIRKKGNEYAGKSVFCAGRNPKIINFYGMEDLADIYLYMATILSRLGKKVLVIDNSKEHLFSECIPGLPDASGIVEFRYISYMKDKQYDEDFFFLYDVILNICGYNYDEEMDEKSDFSYVIMDYQKVHFLKFQSIAQRLMHEYRVIYRDFSNERYNAQYIEFSMGAERSRIIDRYVISLAPQDYTNMMQVQYSMIFFFEHLSLSYRQVLADITAEIYHELSGAALGLLNLNRQHFIQEYWRSKS